MPIWIGKIESWIGIGREENYGGTNPGNEAKFGDLTVTSTYPARRSSTAVAVARRVGSRCIPASFPGIEEPGELTTPPKPPTTPSTTPLSLHSPWHHHQPRHRPRPRQPPNITPPIYSGTNTTSSPPAENRLQQIRKGRGGGLGSIQRTTMIL